MGLIRFTQGSAARQAASTTLGSFLCQQSHTFLGCGFCGSKRKADLPVGHFVEWELRVPTWKTGALISRVLTQQSAPADAICRAQHASAG